MRNLLAILAALWLCSSAAAFSEADRAAIQSTIERQLQAFLADDGATAYSFAAPNIKMIYPSAEAFMDMVRQGYQPVYRPQGHTFGELKEEPGYLEQAVDIIDAEGVAWTAVYTLSQQADGSWQITGCYLVKKPGSVA